MNVRLKRDHLAPYIPESVVKGGQLSNATKIGWRARGGLSKGPQSKLQDKEKENCSLKRGVETYSDRVSKDNWKNSQGTGVFRRIPFRVNWLIITKVKSTKKKDSSFSVGGEEVASREEWGSGH